MTIYKLVIHESEYVKRSDRHNILRHHEDIFIGDVKHAKEAFAAVVRNMESNYVYPYRGKVLRGVVKLFVPHIFKNGLLAYWSDNKECIEMKEFKTEW
jgi:hypothetical protein